MSKRGVDLTDFRPALFFCFFEIFQKRYYIDMTISNAAMTFEDLKGCLLRYELDGDDDIDHTIE